MVEPEGAQVLLVGGHLLRGHVARVQRRQRVEDVVQVVHAIGSLDQVGVLDDGVVELRFGAARGQGVRQVAKSWFSELEVLSFGAKKSLPALEVAFATSKEEEFGVQFARVGLFAKNGLNFFYLSINRKRC